MTRGQRAAARKAQERADAKRFTQAAIAEDTGLSINAVNSFMNGHSWPRGRNLAAYERVLGWPTGHLTRIADQADEEIQAIHEAEPGERRLLGLVQDLRGELDGRPIDQWSLGVQREVQRLVQQLAGLGAEHHNVRPIRLRPVAVIAAELELERALRLDTLESGVPGAEAIAERHHDPKIQRLAVELDLARRHAESSVTGS